MRTGGDRIIKRKDIPNLPFAISPVEVAAAVCQDSQLRPYQIQSATNGAGLGKEEVVSHKMAQLGRWMMEASETNVAQRQQPHGLGS